MADTGVTTEGEGAVQERRETESNTAFSIKFDKAALEEERANIAPEGYATLDAILKLPDVLAVPKETMLIIGPNGIGKSTLLSVFDMVGEAVGTMDRAKQYNLPDQSSWEKAIEMATDDSNKTDTERKKMGLAPNIARHITIVDGADNIGTTRYWRIPEETGKLWDQMNVDEQGFNHIEYVRDNATDKMTPVEVFKRGTEARNSGVVGSTQQIIDRKIFGYMEEDILSGKGPFTELLDEPTANADLYRSLGIISELEQMNARVDHRAHFIIATNEGLLALNRNVARIDMANPERGVHYGKDYPLEDATVKALAEMGYAPIQES